EITKLEEESSSYSKNINLSSLFKQVVDSVNNRSTSQAVEIDVKIDETVPAEINIDDIRLKYILTALLTVSKISSSGKTVTIKTTPLSNDKLQIIIQNSKSSIDKELLKSMFDPFVLSKKLDAAEHGLTGLSLTLAHRYITFLNGEINAKHNSNDGVTFNFTIKADMHKTAPKVDFTTLPKPTKEKNSILVIEDDYATSKSLSNYLNKWGYSPTIVNTGEQTMSQIAKEKFLAIILDIEIPSTNGLELLKKINEHDNTKNVPVIVCSIDPDKQKAYLMGAVEYFVKPINYNYLVEVLTSYKLRKNSNILCIDDDIPTLNLVKQAIETAGFIAIA
ncbi:MAG: response regulator, partial [Melioribacteraceae bacterium]|nr:response regulator [Melioribacteraceae bacterium]